MRRRSLLIAAFAVCLAGLPAQALPRPKSTSSPPASAASAQPADMPAPGPAATGSAPQPKAVKAQPPSPPRNNKPLSKAKSPAPPKPCTQRWRPRVPQGYRAAVDQWHRPVITPARTDAKGRPYLTLDILNTAERIEVAPQHDTGRFSAFDLDRLSHALRDQRRGFEHPFAPELVDLVYDIQRHFNANAVRVVSGYRAPSAASHSNHGRGRAMDLIVPGASNEDVARYVRARGFVGVGTYPNSGFVHIDVRPASYYWIDSSGPGERNCERATASVEARSNDTLSRAAGRRPVRSWSDPSANVDGVWNERRPTRELEIEPREDWIEEDDLDAERE